MVITVIVYRLGKRSKYSGIRTTDDRGQIKE